MAAWGAPSLGPDVFDDVGGFDRQAFDHGDEAAGAAETLDSFGDQAGRGEAVHQRLHEVGLGLRLHAGRDFLGQDFKQKLGHSGVVCACRMLVRECSGTSGIARVLEALPGGVLLRSTQLVSLIFASVDA